MHLPRLIFFFISFIKIATCCSQDTANYYITDYKAGKNNSNGSFVTSLGNTTMLQSNWSPYRNMPFVDISYMWSPGEGRVTVDAGMSLSFGFNNCDQCTSAASSSDMTFDADFVAFKVGVGKRWITDGVSFFLIGGGLFAVSEYRIYLSTPNGSSGMNDYIDSSRNHGGIYLKFGADWRIGHGNDKTLGSISYRLGPFIETKITSGQSRQELYLNINSISIGVMIGLRKDR